MIGKLRGILIDKQPGQILLELNNIGYEVEISLADYAELPELGTELEVHTHLHVREDAQLLYGFLTKENKWTFRQLIRANGVGAKLAMVILSGMSPQQIASAVADKDINSFSKVPGIGKKTAERLIIELSDKLDSAMPSDAQSSMDFNQKSEAIEALLALGYKANQAKNVVDKVADKQMSVQEILRLALQQIN